MPILTFFYQTLNANHTKGQKVYHTYYTYIIVFVCPSGWRIKGGGRRATLNANHTKGQKVHHTYYTRHVGTFFTLLGITFSKVYRIF
jgi:hypothetical protein